MKLLNIIFTLLLLIIITSCSNSKAEQRNIPQDGYFEYTGGIWGSIEYKIEQKTIDSCQYIVMFGSQGLHIIHKANCNNIYHINK